MGTVWYPSYPRCIPVPPGLPVSVIAGCSVGGAVCLLLILAAIYMLYRSRGEGLQEKQRDLLQKAKIMHLNFFMSSFQQDNVGMPAVTADSVDCELRGVTSSCPVMSSADETDTQEELNEKFDEFRSHSRRSSAVSITSAGDLEHGDDSHVDRL